MSLKGKSKAFFPEKLRPLIENIIKEQDEDCQVLFRFFFGSSLRIHIIQIDLMTYEEVSIPTDSCAHAQPSHHP